MEKRYGSNIDKSSRKLNFIISKRKVLERSNNRYKIEYNVGGNGKSD